MGFFSWKTQDSHRSIANNAQSYRDTFTVIMNDDKGNQFIETDYEGYGVFGGKDYYELLAEMNGKKTRDEGITLAFSENENIKFPSLTECGMYMGGVSPENCEFQGYFYNWEEDEEEDENY